MQIKRVLSEEQRNCIGLIIIGGSTLHHCLLEERDRIVVEAINSGLLEMLNVSQTI